MPKKTIKAYDTKLGIPLGDTIVAEPFELVTKIDGIMIAPEERNHEDTKSVVRAVGPDVKHVRPGDVIFHSRYAGSPTAINEKNFIVMREHRSSADLFGIYFGNRPIDIKPVDDILFLEWEEGSEKYQGTNIQKVGVDMDRHYTGIIITMGPAVENPALTPGKRVFFNQFCSPERVDYNGKRYAFIREYDALMIIPSRTEMAVLG
jgi:co-chaperonin GroES (HSP10)